MFLKKKPPPIKSLIAQGSEITGDFKFSEGLRVDGAVIGNIRSSDDERSLLVISEQACVTGEIRADHIIINGTVKGPIHAHVMLELQPKARIEGDVNYAALEMHQGALVAGQLRPILPGGTLGAVADEVAGEDKPTLKLAANNG